MLYIFRGLALYLRGLARYFKGFALHFNGLSDTEALPYLEEPCSDNHRA